MRLNLTFISRTFYAICLLVLMSLPLQAQTIVGEHVDAQLISEVEGVYAGQELWLALRLEHKDGWHTYWKNPGDAGKATEISWQLPEGVIAGDIIWPTPIRMDLPADIVDFGYEDEVFLLSKLTLPENLSGEVLTVNAEVNWYECKDICIPVWVDLELSLPIVSVKATLLNQEWHSTFEERRANFPSDDIEFDAMYNVIDGRINLVVQATENIFEEAQSVRFIPGQHRVFNYLDEPQINVQLSSMQLSQIHHSRVLTRPPEVLEGLLLVTTNDGKVISYNINALADEVSLNGLGDVFGNIENPDMSFLAVFVFAFLGGLLLNIMPCVLPVLSLKALSLVSMQDSSIGQQRRHGVVYTLGVIAAFLALASVLLILKAGGALIGWGFHLQSPWFVALFAYVFFILALSLSGVIELGAGVMGVGSSLSDKKGYAGSFFTGVLASVVGAPCTIPFMGAALGFALTQSAFIALSAFVALGLGMASPFLVLSFAPALVRFLPKPGHWMVTFKKIMALPLYLWFVWLLWVLERQAGLQTMVVVIICCGLLAIAVRLYQKQRENNAPFNAKSCVVVLCVIIAFGVLPTSVFKTRISASSLAGQDDSFETYSDARLSELREEGQAVFVNMTASWCVTCIVNERLTLSSETFLSAMSANNVVYLKGDWTSNDPEITEVLKRYQTSGVPLYLMFPRDKNLGAQVLPQLLTESIMLEALDTL